MNILRQQRGKDGNRGGESRQGEADGGALTKGGVLVKEGTCNEASAVVSVVVVEVAEAFTFVARQCLTLSPTRGARSNSAEEGEAVGRREVAEVRNSQPVV